MNITLIGSGNVATHLGQALKVAGHRIIQVYSRTQAHAEILASQLQAQPISEWKAITNAANLYVFALKDSALCEAIPMVCAGKMDKIFVHTAGSVAMDVFKGYAKYYGVIYPLQTFSKQRQVDFQHIPCFLEASDEATAATLQQLTQTLTSTIHWMSSSQRQVIHLAAVFACNFTNHCYALANEVLQTEQIPFSTLLPLINETVSKVNTLTPQVAQTGPAVRFDENIINKQLELLRHHPRLQKIYELMSQSIHVVAQNQKVYD